VPEESQLQPTQEHKLFLHTKPFPRTPSTEGSVAQQVSITELFSVVSYFPSHSLSFNWIVLVVLCASSATIHTHTQTQSLQAESSHKFRGLQQGFLTPLSGLLWLDFPPSVFPRLCSANGGSSKRRVFPSLPCRLIFASTGQIPPRPPTRQYAKVFSEHESEQLPEPQPWGHTIDLKPDAPETLWSKVYPISRICRSFVKSLDSWSVNVLQSCWINSLLACYYIVYPYISSFGIFIWVLVYT